MGDDNCWWNPNSPECQGIVVENTEAPRVYHFTKWETIEAQGFFILAGGLELAQAYLMTMRYRSGGWKWFSQYESAVDSLNVWKLATFGLHYGKLGLFAVALLLQLLSLLGGLNELTLLVWNWGIFVGVPVLEVLYLLGMGYAYDRAVADGCLGKSSAASCSVARAMDSEWAMFFGWAALSHPLFYIYYAKWYQGQELAMKGPPIPYTEFVDPELEEEAAAL